MRLQNHPIVVAKRDKWGPFADGRTVEYLEFIDTDGGGIMRATFAQGVEIAEGLAVPGAMCVAELELYQAEKGLRLRLHGLAASAAKVRAAA